MLLVITHSKQTPQQHKTLLLVIQFLTQILQALTTLAWVITTLTASTTGVGNVCIGNSSGQAITTGQNNVCLGRGAGQLITGGSENLMLGRKAGETSGPTNGSRNVLIGLDTGCATNGQSNLVVASGSSATSKGNSTGFISPNGGPVYQGNNSSTWSTTSDRRLKKNIVDNTAGLAAINDIRVRNFEYRLPEEVTELDAECAIQKQAFQRFGRVIAQDWKRFCQIASGQNLQVLSLLIQTTSLGTW